jgi:pyroglutamyl-peptidase
VKVLLTGFGPFPGIATNPSATVVEHLAASSAERSDVEIVTSILATEYARAGNSIRELISRVGPDAVICIGTAAKRTEINLERVALNLDDAAIPDNAGTIIQGKLIAPEGPVAYWSTLPLDRIHAGLRDRGIPATMSNHAGTYVCNHTFYVARHEIERTNRRVRCGLIHIPLAAEVTMAEDASAFALPVALLTEAIEICVAVLAGS